MIADKIAETSDFAMRQLILFFLALSLLVLPFSGRLALAQNSDNDLYTVTDVPVDITADNAAHARDEAIVQAQRAALAELVEHVGANQSANKISDDDLATLVQSFEVQDEHASSVRYIGTYTVQFRPAATHDYLASHGGTSFVAIPKTKPIVVLPVVNTNGHPILWEETTKWRSAWETAAHNNGLVPVIVPGGDLDDIAVLSTEEAVSGKASALKAIIDKYHAMGAAVATLNVTDPSPPDGLRVDVQNYDDQGNSLLTTHLTLTTSPDKTLLDSNFAEGIKEIRTEFEKDWKQLKPASKETASSSASPAETSGSAPPSPGTPPVEQNLGPVVTLPLTVPLVSLTEWAQIRARLHIIPSIRRIEVITLARGSTSLELSFTGSIDDLRAALAEQGLTLNKSTADGGWVLRPTEPSNNTLE